jgi:hypothetical protein
MCTFWIGFIPYTCSTIIIINVIIIFIFIIIIIIEKTTPDRTQVIEKGWAHRTSLNIWEYRRGNNKWAIQRDWQHWVHKTQDENKTKTTQYVLDTAMRKPKKLK